MRFVPCTLVLLIGATAFPLADARVQAASAGLQPQVQPTFDVVAIRPMKEDDSTPQHITNPARSGYLKAVNVNLKGLMEVAYDIPDLRMYGGPEWTTTAKYSLEAKADPALNVQMADLSLAQGKEAKRMMLVALLAERFKLKVHTETREMPVYAMVVAKGGPKLGGGDAGGGSSTGGGGQIRIDPGGDSLAFLSYELSWRLGRPVIDRTGLSYKQKVMLSWQEEGEASVDASGPSLFTAMQEQLGLRLESTRGPVLVMVIDHAEKPLEN